MGVARTMGFGYELGTVVCTQAYCLKSSFHPYASTCTYECMSACPSAYTAHPPEHMRLCLRCACKCPAQQRPKPTAVRHDHGLWSWPLGVIGNCTRCSYRYNY